MNTADQLRPVEAPWSGLRAMLREDSDGLALHVRSGSTPLLDIAPLGVLAGAGDLARPAVTDRTDHAIDDTYTTTTGKRLDHRHRANQATFRLTAGDVELELDVRVSDDGVAYRHRLLGQGAAAITDEPAVFAAHGDPQAWMSPYTENYELPWRGERRLHDLPGGGTYGFPVLLGWDDGPWCLLTEAAVDETYAASRLITQGDGRFRLSLPQESVTSVLPWATPWRVAVIGELATVVESELVTALNPPSRVDDVSWIRPGRVAWSWWSQKYSPADPGRQRAYVDYAAEQGWEYVLVDARWDAAWLPELVGYANDRAVGVLIWSHWSDLASRQQRDEQLARWKSWGVAGIKVDFMDSDTQQRMAWYEALAHAAAEHRLMVNYHGSTVPKGRQRTWPHVMTYEGICGAEHYVRDADVDGAAFITSTDGPDAEHNTIVAFTRNVVGSMDYTPVTVSNARRPTSPGHELALSVVFESGWQHFADSIEAYGAHPLMQSFLNDVPTVWDETRLVCGYPGRFVVLARRRGPRWFLGGIVAGLPRVIEFRLDVLDPELEYMMRIVEDDSAGGVAERSLRARGGDIVRTVVTGDGGFVAGCEPVERIR